jgi:hypothetical protein
MDFDDSASAEALARHRRYQEDVVEEYAVCPWAKAARQAGRLRAHVILGASPHPRELETLIDEWADDAECDAGFIIAPNFIEGIDAFDHWAAAVGALRSDAFLGAPFHPNAPPDAGVVRFLRQTPDPTVQLVRRSKLDEIRAQDPPHYQDIFALNLHALQSSTPMRTVAAAVLAHNTRLVAEQGDALSALFERLQKD